LSGKARRDLMKSAFMAEKKNIRIRRSHGKVDWRKKRFWWKKSYLLGNVLQVFRREKKFRHWRRLGGSAPEGCGSQSLNSFSEKVSETKEGSKKRRSRKRLEHRRENRMNSTGERRHVLYCTKRTWGNAKNTRKTSRKGPLFICIQGNLFPKRSPG